MSASTTAANAAGVSDAHVIERSVACPEEFSLIFDRHAAGVRGYLRRRIGSLAADDLLAETFLIAFERRTRYDATVAGARPWLLGIATNLLRRFARSEVRAYRALARTGVDRIVPPIEDQVADRVDAGATRRALAAALASLNRGDRDAILLYAWAELSYEQIAEALDIPVGTVRSRLHRARRKLQVALTDTASEEE
jgi:RNA polymerase sigma-70 factor (ECF subfamily)